MSSVVFYSLREHSLTNFDQAAVGKENDESDPENHLKPLYTVLCYRSRSSKRD
jgi:hypothetical protein